MKIYKKDGLIKGLCYKVSTVFFTWYFRYDKTENNNIYCLEAYSIGVKTIQKKEKLLVDRDYDYEIIDYSELLSKIDFNYSFNKEDIYEIY